jgi:hypothetical protein
VVIEEMCWLVIDCRRAIVQLEVNWAEIGMVIVLMPSDHQFSFWFDPVESVILVRVGCFQFEPDFDPCLSGWIRLVVEKRPWIDFTNHSIHARVASGGPCDTYFGEMFSPSLLDPVVKPSELQI